MNNFKFLLVEKSFNKRYELKIDISQFYSTIYTHSITWALLGKNIAKRYFALKNDGVDWNLLLRTDRNARLYDIGNRIDTLVRSCQEKQSVGLPIGPDTSFIIAEVIGCRIDNEIQSKIDIIDYECIRYYDDYYFYVNSYDDAEKILKICQQVLNDFQLATNESKIRINRLPFSFETSWASSLTAFKFHKIDKFELRDFFSILYRLIEENKEESNLIIQYALGRFEYGNVRVSKGNWDIFLNFLIKTLLIDCSNIDQFLKILLSYKPYVTNSSREKLAKFLNRIINEHLILNHSFEVSWALWLIKSFGMKCDAELLQDILSSEDHISRIICLDLIHNKNYRGKKPSLKKLTSELNSEDYVSEKWLFIYEAIKKGWLKPSKRKIGGNKYFDILFNHNVTFYNPQNQIKTEFSIKAQRTVKPDVSNIIKKLESSSFTSSY